MASHRLVTPSVNISPLLRHYHYAVLHYVRRAPRSHQHLDWEPLAQWLHDPQNIGAMAWEGDELVGLMIFSPVHEHTSWLRLLVISYPDEKICFDELWAFVWTQLQSQGAQALAAMSPQLWVKTRLLAVGFSLQETVINLYRSQGESLPPPVNTQVQIQKARGQDFQAVLGVDWAAFAPLWQMRESDLREAIRRAHYYTLARLQDQVVGYQIAMRYGQAMHLARLATHPDYQNQRIGSALVVDLLRYADQSGAERLTVNTQNSNSFSQRIYQNYGFRSDDHDLPIYIRQH